MGEACCARAGTFEVCLSPGRRVVRQTTALAPGTDGPVKVTGGRASGEVTWPVCPGPGSVLCQEGPAEEGGASHPRSTVTHCHIWLKST